MTTTPADLLRHVHNLVATHSSDQLTDRQLLERFAAVREEAAFAALLRRHGPMVLGVCRRVLHHEQDAEDAFQAVFLILARKAGSIRQIDVGGYLYRVAYRLARRAGLNASRRERLVGAASRAALAPARPAGPTSVDPMADVTWREVRAIVDEELQCLPEELRSAVVLCYLEGQTQEEAARRLSWSKGTLRRRLDRGRERLRRRLLARGLAPMAALTASLFADSSTSATVPAALIDPTIRLVLGSAASPAVAALAEAGVGIVGAGNLKAATAVLLLVSVFAGAGLWALHTPAAPQADAKEKANTLKPRTPREEKKSTVQVGGRVVDPDGKPVRGAKLLFLWWGEKLPHKIWATSAADGRFQFEVAQPPVANAGWDMPRENVYVMAAAEGYGFAVAPLDKPETAANLTLRLVKDDVPIRGRVLTLEGKPIAGVRVRLNDLEPLNQPQVYVPKKGDLTVWLAALKTSKNDAWDLERTYFAGLYSSAFHLLFPPVTTGADGRFELRGLGRERLVHLRLEGPTIATQIVNVMTRPGEKIRLPLTWRHPKGETITYHGAAFEVLAEPTKPVVGVVRDRDTGKPLAGVTIWPNKITNPWKIVNHNAGLIRTTTDKEGRYRLVGLPKGEDNQITAMTDDLPYLPVRQKIENTPGLGPVTVDFALNRGVWVKGRVTEKTTGKPLRGGVGYYCFNDNPHKKEIPLAFGGSPLGGSTRDDGSFRFVVVPGRGLLAVQVAHNNRYLSRVGVEKIKVRRDRMGEIEYLDTYPFCHFGSYNTLVEIAPKPGDESITCDLIVVPGRTLKGTVLGPDGKPLAGARLHRWDTLPGSDFTLWGLPPEKLRKPRVIELVHEGKKLAGFVTAHGDEKAPLQVRLQPWGAVTGRLVTPRGEPLTGVTVSCSSRVGDDYPDEQGRFRIEGLIPGRKYRIDVSREGLIQPIVGGEPKDLMVKPGETKDLGELRVKPAN